MKKQKILFVFVATTLLALLPSNGTLVPTLDLDGLCEQSSLILVGQVVSVTEVERTRVQYNDRTIAARGMVAELRVDHVLKGKAPDAHTVRFQYVVPEEFIGWRSVGSQSYRIFFLNQSADGLMLSNPYYPSMVAIPVANIQAGHPIQQVIAQLGAVLEDELAPSSDRVDAVHALNSSRHAEAVQVLTRSSQAADTTVRLSVSAALLEHNDTSTLPYAETILLNPPPMVSPELVHNLSYAIREGVKDERAVPALSGLLRSENPEVRRAAASALLHTGSKSAVDPLLSAIDDTDQEVRFYSAVALAEITGQVDWRPNLETFEANETKYLSHWREWALTRQ